jgi:hypothetical protein
MKGAIYRTDSLNLLALVHSRLDVFFHGLNRRIIDFASRDRPTLVAIPEDEKIIAGENNTTHGAPIVGALAIGSMGLDALIGKQDRIASKETLT